MNDAEFFAPWRLVAAFADGSRLLFDGLSEEQAYDAMVAAQERHGDIGYWKRDTDQNYEDGRYYKTIPPCISWTSPGTMGHLTKTVSPSGCRMRSPGMPRSREPPPMPRRSSSSATHPTKRRTSNEPHSPGSSIGYRPVEA